MWMLHVLYTPGLKQAHIKLNQYKYCTKALFVINADCEFIRESLNRQIKHTTYNQQHKVCDAATILTLTLHNFYQRTVM